MRGVCSQRTAAWRGYGDETPIGKWIRSNPNLPSRSENSAFAVCNTDLTIHAYMQAVDGVGSRSVQSLIRVEWKSHGKRPEAWQLDTLFKEHAGLNRSARGYRVKGATVINHGIYFCVCSASTPSDSETILWGRFKPDGSVDWRQITESELNDILAFNVHPKTLRRQWLRRHHKTREVHVLEKSDLGFTVAAKVVERS